MQNCAEIYLDNAAAAMPETEVLDFYREKLAECYANQEALHAFAYRERAMLGAAAGEFSRLLTGRDDFPVIWGGSATEIFHLLGGAPFFRSVLLSELEHPALTANFSAGKQLHHFQVGRNGLLSSEFTGSQIDLVCCHQVQSELGAIQDLDAVFAPFPDSCCRLVDAVQAAGKLPVYTRADIIVISGAKFGAPGGAAALLAPRGRFTGKLLEYAKKARSENYICGRVNVPQILTMVYALSRAEAAREENFSRMQQLRAFLQTGCSKLQLVPTLPETVPVSPYILNMLLPHEQAAVVVRALSGSGVYTAPGSACSAESSTPSAALLAIGRKKEEAFRALRISLSPRNTEAEGKIFLSALEKVLKNY